MQSCWHVEGESQASMLTVPAQPAATWQSRTGFCCAGAGVEGAAEHSAEAGAGAQHGQRQRGGAVCAAGEQQPRSAAAAHRARPHRRCRQAACARSHAPLTDFEASTLAWSFLYIVPFICGHTYLVLKRTCSKNNNNMWSYDFARI